MFYSFVPILALAIHIIVNFDFFFGKNVTYNVKGFKAYRAFCYVIALFFITDLVWGICDQAGLSLAASIDTAVYFAMMAFSVLFWLRFTVHYLCEKGLFSKVLLFTGWILLVLGLSAVIVNFFHPILFAFDSNAQYEPKMGRYLFFGVQMIMYFFASLLVFFESLKKEGAAKLRCIIIVTFGLIMAAFIGLQISFPHYPLYSFGLAVGIGAVRMIVVNGERTEFRAALAESKLRESKQREALGSARALAYIDQLTGTRNKHAYVANEEEVDTKIRNGTMPQFCVIVFDLNDLKLINDTKGHETGDRYIVDSVALIRHHFHDPHLYRYGGDEFVLLLEGGSFDRRHECLKAFNDSVMENIGKDAPVVATGLSDYRIGVDNTLRAVFSRADEAMYMRKRKLKQETNPKLGVRSDIYEMFYRSKDCSLIEMLNNSSCDEIVEVDLTHDTFRQFYHVDGKYSVPNVEVSYQDLYHFVLDYIVHPDDREIYARFMNPERFLERLSKCKIPNFDFAHFRYRLQDGEYRYVEQCVIAGEENDIPPGAFRIYISDIHNLKIRQLGQESNQALVISEDRDPLTGLLMEEPFFPKAQQIIAEQNDAKWCLMCLDVEHFRFFDEWYGRETGDLLLAKIGAVLAENESRLGGLACYLGQDDFCLLLRLDKAEISRIYEEVRSLIVSFGLSIGFLPAVGIAQIEGRMHVVDAYDRANIAIARAKKDIRNRICYFEATMKNSEEEEYRILSEFMAGIKNDEFTFFLQPQCRISNGAIVGAESLARWIKIDGTIVPPNDYIPVLEKYGFVCDLDQVLWEKACAWLRKWIDEGHKPVPLSLNVSRADIFTIDIAKHFKDLAAKYDLPHKLIKLEITESAYTETTVTIEDLVKELRADGFLVMMDDFGAGYSSLNMLSNLEIDAIKLDAHFLHIGGEAYKKGIHILESVVNMGKTIGLPMIVEGVETKEQVEFLSDLGCRFVQGFYYYRPMPVEEFEKLILDEKKLDNRGLSVKLNEQFRLRELLDKNIYSDTMLNNILGSVALYSWHDQEHVDIVRFNQQFYESVNVPDFHDRLVNIEQFLPSEDRPKMIAVLSKAMENRLGGAAEILHFYKTDGSLSSFNIHFYYLGKKEGGERFYGSAVNVTKTSDLEDEMSLISKYSHDNLIFVRYLEGKWSYHVASHGLADVIGLTPAQLEAEMNDGRFAKRVNKAKLAEFMKTAANNAKEKKDFSQVFAVRGKGGKYFNLELHFYYVGDGSANTQYVLRTNIIDK